MDEQTFDVDLDMRGVDCPLPMLKTKTQLVRMEAGQVLRVRATDPHSVLDFVTLCDKTGHALIRRWQDDEVFYFLIRKG